jgi:TolA-binding protein
LWLAAIVALAVAAPPSYPQRQLSEREMLTDLTREVLNLRDKMNKIQADSEAKNAAMIKLVEQVLDRLAPLQASVQKVNESLAAIQKDHTTSARDVQDLRKALETVKTDMTGFNEKLSGLGIQLRSGFDTVAASKAAETPLPSAGALFTQAMGSYSAQIHRVAISEFKDFLQQYPRDSRSPSAQFYVGMSYVALKEQQMAIDAFDELLQKYPGSDRTCSALYEKGQLLGGQKKNPEAKVVYQEALKMCPAGSPEATNTTAALKALR